MAEVSVPWGREQLTFKLPEHWTLQQVAEPALRPAPKDWPDRLGVAMSQPGTGLPLSKLLTARRGGRILLVLEDVTRHSPLPQILEPVMREIRYARVGDNQVEVLFATGMHPPMTARQAGEKLGPAAEGIRWRCNPWDDPARYVHVGDVGRVSAMIDRGVAGADLRIIISSVSPHLQAGFGGGYKMLVPGCANLETIRSLHRLGVERVPRQLVGMDAGKNPMRAVIDAVGQKIDQAGGKSFAVQYLLDNDDLPAFIATGEVIPTYRMVAKQCSVACGIITSGPADVLITNAHPRDYDLWQSFKCIPNTRWAVRPNGVIICLARSEAGAQGMDVPRRWGVGPAWMRRLVRTLGPEAIASLVTRMLPALAGEAAFFVRMALQTIYRNHVLMVSPRLVETIGHFPGLRLFASVDQAIAAADAILGRKPQRVAVYPAGGTTFPVPPPNAAEHRE